jgi:class 3 adenylate cyclase
MAVIDDLNSKVTEIFSTQWNTQQGQVVPDPEALRLSNHAIEFDRATILYADLKGSTTMVGNETWQVSGEIYKAFLHCAASLIRAEGGAITSYDGDRVMGIWIGNHQSTPAAKCALKINHAVTKIITPAFKKQYPSSHLAIKHVVGIDTSPIRAARTGVRGGNDIVWIGRAANYAAKLTDLGHMAESTFITDDVFKKMADEAKFGSNPKVLMWKLYKWSQNGDIPIHGSDWTWPP